MTDFALLLGVMYRITVLYKGNGSYTWNTFALDGMARISLRQDLDEEFLSQGTIQLFSGLVISTTGSTAVFCKVKDSQGREWYDKPIKIVSR